MAWYPSNGYRMYVRFDFSGLFVDEIPQKLVSLVNTGFLNCLHCFL